MPFILITVLLDMLGFGLIVPVLPNLVTTMQGGSISQASATYGWFVATYALMQFVFSPILGNLSDAIGRRPVILVSLFGAGLDYLLMAFAPNLTWLFIGRVVSGITGANITAANAYIADVSPPEQRARNFGLIGACFGVGFVLGPAAGGLLGHFGLRTPFMAAAGLTLLNALYGFFVLPESHPAERRRAFDWRRANPLASLRVLGHYPVVLGLTASLVLASLAHQAFPSTWVLYTTYRFHWTELDNGLSLAAVGLTAIVVQGGLTGMVITRFGERRALLFGMTVSCVNFVLYGLANQGWMFYCIIVVGSIGAVASPALQSLISRQIPLDEQGAVQGALTSLQSLTGIAGPILVTHLFGYFISDAAPVHLPGAAFFFGSILVATAVLVAARNLRRPEFRAAPAAGATADPDTPPPPAGQ
jgi:DHA1 family tetracycline resistance protein-like MFS transporter